MQGATAGRKSISVSFCGSQCLSGIPFPPTDNNIYRTLPNHGRTKTKEANNFVKDFQIWAMVHNQEIKLSQKWFRDPSFVAVTVVLGCHAKRLYTKKGAQKKFDGQNRQKLVLDCLAKAIGIDDRNFWSVQIVKTEIPDDKPEELAVVIRPVIPKDYDVVKTLLMEGKNV